MKLRESLLDLMHSDVSAKIRFSYRREHSVKYSQMKRFPFTTRTWKESQWWGLSLCAVVFTISIRSFLRSRHKRWCCVLLSLTTARGSSGIRRIPCQQVLVIKRSALSKHLTSKTHGTHKDDSKRYLGKSRIQTTTEHICDPPPFPISVVGRKGGRVQQKKKKKHTTKD